MGTKRKSSSLLSNILNSTSVTNKSCNVAASSINATAATLHTASILNVSNETLSSPEQTLVTFLEGLEAVMRNHSNNGGAAIEVECRLGQISHAMTKKRFQAKEGAALAQILPLTESDLKAQDAMFIAGVDASTFDEVTKTATRLSESDRYAKVTEQSLVSSFPKGLRVLQAMEPEGGRPPGPPRQQTKTRLGLYHFFCPHCPYDIRIAVASEGPLDGLEGFDAWPSPEHVRHKDRLSIMDAHVSIDLTRVKETMETATQRETFEVEIELKPQGIVDWLSAVASPDGMDGSGVPAARLLYRHMASLWYVLKLCMPDVGAATPLKMSYGGHDDITHAYRRDVQSSSMGFPGTMPVGFARWHIPTLARQNYYVSEKTDGVRYFLVIANGYAVLVDRTGAHFTASGLDALVWLCPSGTVLDGEFVKHQRTSLFTFMAFDILYVGAHTSDRVAALPFEQRLQSLKNFIGAQSMYGQGLASKELPLTALLPIVRKRWVPLSQLSHVFHNITRVTLNTVGKKQIARVYSEDTRTHFTDGIVFCPGNASYVFGTDLAYLKWKWSELITIDFKASLQGMMHGASSSSSSLPPVALSCGGPKGADIHVNNLIKLDPIDLAPLVALLSRLPSKSAIMECGFVPDSGLWRTKHHRVDKDRANYITTVLGSVLNIAEWISEEELQYRLLDVSSSSGSSTSSSSAAAGDDWNDKAKHLRRELLKRKSLKHQARKNTPTGTQDR